jgi:hemerythrin-like domain-containing protein
MNGKWHYNASENAWTIVHNAIRQMITDYIVAIEIVLLKAKNNDVKLWQIEYLKKYWKYMEHVIECHHEIEETILFPWMNEQVMLPLILTEQHNLVSNKIVDCKDKLSIINLNTKQTIIDIKAFCEGIKELKKAIFEHFDYEENIAISTVHKCFTPEEYKKIETKIIERMKTEDIGWFFHGFRSKTEKKNWLSKVAKIPWHIQMFAVFPICKKFEKTTQKLLTDIMTIH